jgi:hypothetical protein
VRLSHIPMNAQIGAVERPRLIEVVLSSAGVLERDAADAVACEHDKPASLPYFD